MEYPQVEIIQESLDQLIIEGMKQENLLPPDFDSNDFLKQHQMEPQVNPEILQNVLGFLSSPKTSGLNLKLDLAKKSKRRSFGHSQNFVFCGFTDRILVSTKRKNAKQTTYDKYMNCFRFQV